MNDHSNFFPIHFNHTSPNMPSLPYLESLLPGVLYGRKGPPGTRIEFELGKAEKGQLAQRNLHKVSSMLHLRNK
jgi:hypothetical protein